MATKRKSRLYKEFKKDSIEDLQIIKEQQLEILDSAVKQYKYKEITLRELKRLEKHYEMIKEILENKLKEEEKTS